RFSLLVLVEDCRRNLARGNDIHVLDAGCGTGNYSSALLERGLGQVTMIDASSGMLQQARDKLGHALADGRVKQMLEVKLPELPFPDKTFDAVMFNLAITEARRVIKKNGVLIVTTQLPNILKNNLWFSRINENLTERNMKRWPELDYYESTFSAAKFELVETVNILSKHYLNENEFYEGPLHDWWRDTDVKISSNDNYNSTSRNYDEQRLPLASDTIAVMIQFLISKTLKNIHVLDAVSGTGNYSSALLERGIGQVTISDASSGMLQQAKDKLGHALADGRVKQMLEAKTVSCIYFRLSKAIRVIKKNGVLIVTPQLPNILKNKFWFSQINENLTERNMKCWPDLDYYERTFCAAKFELVETFDILSKHYLKENEFYEGPLHDWWRDT
ncbi:hypothetical protein MAR_026917, partial [Mya arenaria]